jgi:hypothetical protein
MTESEDHPNTDVIDIVASWDTSWNNLIVVEIS